MKQLKYLTLKDNTTLTSIDFVSSDGVTQLIELDLRNTGVKGENSLINLNENAKSLKTLRVSNGSGFAKIVDTINRLRTGAEYCYWSAFDMGGLNCDNVETLKELEKLENLQYLYGSNGSNCIGDSTVVLDLRNTKIKDIHLAYVIANIYLPSTIESCYLQDGGIPIVSEKSEKLVELYNKFPRQDMIKKEEYFKSLKNAQNLKTLSLTRLYNLNFKSLADYINYELPNVEYLNLSGYQENFTNSYLKDLNGIEKFKNLKSLAIDYTDKPLDIEALKNCDKIEIIRLTYCHLQNIESLKELKNLQNLNLSNNNISNLKPLENLKNLAELNLENNAISDTATYTDTDGSVKTVNNINILANLNKNGKLEKLYLKGNDNIVNWSPLTSLTWTEKTGW
jgi:Leucine-rich repeat (LRR) protein